MKRVLILITAILSISGCSMVEVSRDFDNEDLMENADTTGIKKNKPIKGIHIVLPIPQV